jgi:FkbM family methyltransferase
LDGAESLELDAKILRFLAERSTGTVFLDFGAHWGFFTAHFQYLAAARRGRVIALEPDRRHLSLLRRTTDRVHASHCVVVPCALASRDGTCSLYSSASSCMHSFAEPGAVKGYDVEALSLDSLVRRQLAPDERVAVIKIDVDGAEPALFEGGADTLNRHRPALFLEFAPYHITGFGSSPSALFAHMCSEYAVYEVHYRPRRIARLRESDYPALEARLSKQGLTDLVLTREPVDFSSVARTE